MDYPGTNIPIVTVSRILDSLSVFCFGAATTLFLTIEYLARKTGRGLTPISDAMIGTLLVTATTVLGFGTLLIPILSGSQFSVSLSGLLNGAAVGLSIGITIHLLLFKSVASPGPKLSGNRESQRAERS
jgi:hypothetical protein